MIRVSLHVSLDACSLSPYTKYTGSRENHPPEVGPGGGGGFLALYHSAPEYKHGFD